MYITITYRELLSNINNFRRNFFARDAILCHAQLSDTRESGTVHVLYTTLVVTYREKS